MTLFKAYKVVSLLHENDITQVYRALRIKDKKTVILKRLNLGQEKQNTREVP
jgi:hypothetical protein